VRTIRRSEITELDRLCVHVDLVSYAGMEKGVFKYSHQWKGFGPKWQEIHIHARLPHHPNILPIDRLVLDEVSGTRVVGFTMPFIDGGDLAARKDRPFKFKYLKLLLQVVDDLNYKFGIAHHDIASRNLFIDPSTNNLVLFDFSVAAKIGYERERYHLGESVQELKERNDVKGVVLTVHEILTRESRVGSMQLQYIDETDLLIGPEKWVEHPDVELDPGLDAVDYYNELMRWVRARRECPITHYTEAPEHVDWPTEMADPPERKKSYDREFAEKHGLPYIEWARPRGAHLDRSRRLLATGKYANGNEVNGNLISKKEEPSITDKRQEGGSPAGDKATQERDTPPADINAIKADDDAGTKTTATTATTIPAANNNNGNEHGATTINTKLEGTPTPKPQPTPAKTL
ncbi:hypothetical protein C8A03DRAFT_11518, partial [Achaetomium macrosporum]